MASIPQLAAFHKFCQQLSFSVLEEIYPREVVASLLSQDQAWEQRERKLNHLFLLIVWSLSARSSLREVQCECPDNLAGLNRRKIWNETGWSPYAAFSADGFE